MAVAVALAVVEWGVETGVPSRARRGKGRSGLGSGLGVRVSIFGFNFLPLKVVRVRELCGGVGALVVVVL